MVATRQRVAAFLRCSGSEKTIRCGTLATLVLLASGFSSRAPTLPYSLYVLVLAVRLCSFSNIRRVRGRGRAFSAGSPPPVFLPIEQPEFQST